MTLEKQKLTHSQILTVEEREIKRENGVIVKYFLDSRPSRTQDTDTQERHRT